MTDLPLEITPLTIACAVAFGSICAYFAFKRGKNLYKWFAIGFLFGAFGICAFFFLPKLKNFLISMLAKRAKKTLPLSTIQEKPLTEILGPSNKFWYYLDPAHLQQGPMSYDAISTAFQKGEISLSTYVWHEEMSDWTPLQEIASTKK